MRKPFVYVASPYTKGDPCMNTCFQMRVFDQMMNDKIVVPYVPLWSHFQHTAFPRPYQDWVEYDNVIIPFCDAIIRLNAELPDRGYFEAQSSGADKEVELARSLGKPVFFDITSLYEWAKGN